LREQSSQQKIYGTGYRRSNTESFKVRKKMVGDLPDSSTRFDVWEERYESFQYIRDELEKMDNSAIDRILLSIRGK